MKRQFNRLNHAMAIVQDYARLLVTEGVQEDAQEDVRLAAKDVEAIAVVLVQPCAKVIASQVVDAAVFMAVLATVILHAAAVASMIVEETAREIVQELVVETVDMVVLADALMVYTFDIERIQNIFKFLLNSLNL